MPVLRSIITIRRKEASLVLAPFRALLMLFPNLPLLAGIIGTQKISTPITIVVSSIAKMFVGDLVETARVVMAERKTSGPIRPCHIREAYRILKLEGKVPRRSVPRLFQ